ncbi:transmembrane protein 218-like [Tribolium madens]|uniref:transmembrane protein 218-like n=1 Tax=Tribolium madens TaxID=41895 RepID=UPI001CF72D3E|nr:transmembrane protein 218-like [Tribolium madens]
MIIGSIGVGLFVLIILWILTLIIFVVGIKYQNNIAWIILIVTTILTITLIIIPLEDPKTPIEGGDSFEKDYKFVYRVILLSFLIASAFLGFIFFFLLHCVERIQPKAIKQFHISSQ